MEYRISSLEARIRDVFLKHLGDNLVSIVLFGSRARGDWRSGSDYDLFVVAEDLPVSRLKRMMFLRGFLTDFAEKICIIAKTREEVDRIFPSLFLDMGLDGYPIFDRGFMEPRLKRIREIIRDAGLRRVRDNDAFHWEWEKRPKGKWAIDWDGYHEF